MSRPLLKRQWIESVGPGLAVLLAAALGMHAWPLDRMPGLRFLWPANLVLIVWGTVGLVWMALNHRAGRSQLVSCVPPVCVWAYLAVSVLSLSSSGHLSRSGVAVAKIALCVVAAYSLVQVACKQLRGPLALLWALTITTSFVSAHAALQSISGATPVALFQSNLKLGSFLAMTVPCAAVFLASHRSWIRKAWAMVLVLVNLCISTSAWGLLGLLIGVIAGGLVFYPMRRWLLTTLLGAIVLSGCAYWQARPLDVIADTQVLQEDGRDVRQRFLEWQALINLLKNHNATGTGVGCLNDRRSEYYLRLPKNNTIAPFDENGYLATAAETGLPGLVGLCWIIGDYLARGWKKRNHVYACAAWAGILGASVAQIASSVAYNGILVAFVYLLAIMDYEPQVEHEEA